MRLRYVSVDGLCHRLYIQYMHLLPRSQMGQQMHMHFAALITILESLPSLNPSQ